METNTHEFNIIDQKFIDSWKQNDFTKWNESDVREDFVAPLLRLLGYAKDTVNEILREKTLNLSESYHRIGRKQVVIDYVPTVRLEKFWIIEAKPGNPKEMDYGDFLQAHLYSIHPEIQAKFIVLTNGWEIRIYDSIYSKDWDDYIFKSTKDDCDKTFLEIKKLLSAKQIGKSIRSNILSLLKSTLSVELDENEVESLKAEFNNIYYESLPIIRKNAFEFQSTRWQKREQKDLDTIKKLNFVEVCYLINRPSSSAPIIGWWVYEKIKEAAQAERDEMLGKLAMNWRGRPHAIFKVQCVNILVRLIEDDIDGKKDGYFSSVYDGLNELVESNMGYWSWEFGNIEDQIGFALSHLDNICARFAYKLCRRIAMEPLELLVQAKKETLAIEDLLSDKPTVAKEMVEFVEIVYDFLWLKFMGRESRQIWETIWHLEFIEETIIDKIPAAEYPDGDFDLLGFENYGKGFDMQCVGTWSILNMRRKQLEGKRLPQCAIELIQKTREQVRVEIPEPLSRPINWQPTDESIIKIFSSISV